MESISVKAKFFGALARLQLTAFLDLMHDVVLHVQVGFQLCAVKAECFLLTQALERVPDQNLALGDNFGSLSGEYAISCNEGEGSSLVQQKASFFLI